MTPAGTVLALVGGTRLCLWSATMAWSVAASHA